MRRTEKGLVKSWPLKGVGLQSVKQAIHQLHPGSRAGQAGSQQGTALWRRAGWIPLPWQTYSSSAGISVMGDNALMWVTVQYFNRWFLNWKAVNYPLFLPPTPGPFFWAPTRRANSLRVMLKIWVMRSYAKAVHAGCTKGLSGLRVWVWRAAWWAASLWEGEELGSITFLWGSLNRLCATGA